MRIDFDPRSHMAVLCSMSIPRLGSVAEKLIREGLGKAWEGDGQHRELLMGVENGAERNGKRGLC